MNRQAVPGIFRLGDTCGFPLEMTILELDSRGMVVAWDDFVADARSHGWTDKTIRRKTVGAAFDAMGAEYGAEFERRMDLLLSSQNDSKRSDIEPLT